MVTYEIHKLAKNTDEIVDYDTAIDHLVEQIDEHTANQIIRYNSDGYCERARRLTVKRRAAIIALEQFLKGNMVQISADGVFYDGFADDVCFGLLIKEVRE